MAQQATTKQQPADRFIGVRDVQNLLGQISRTTVWRMKSDPTFPRAVSVGARTVWSEREISQWIARRLAERAEIA